jgi:radical SAM superfamily enzyme YgiQ (UPF0313 family)
LTTDRIIPHRHLKRLLNGVENPARYVGGEYGQIRKEGDHLFRVALTFPELYEIGMSNTAIKLIYGMLNAMDGISCERVFVPAPDFEAALSGEGVPLYTLETGRPVRSAHVLAVSYGYELLATNFLTILKSSGIPLDRRTRGAGDPIVLLGGPGATNPGPLARYCDGIFIGEAEGALPSAIRALGDIAKRGGLREDLLAQLERERSIWTPDGREPATRAVWTGFGRGEAPRGVPPVEGIPAAYGAGFPVPSIPVVQDYGPIEIMRGCPQGCRFCHAGVYYRPYRMKPVEQILEELRWLVEQQGYRDITLSSLSSGDYSELTPLLEEVNKRYRRRGVSFQLPSLRVNSLTLPILEELSRGRRSGLTFAVEAATGEMQASINKLVPLDRTIAIAREARDRGWQHAKLYFMIGLPESGGTIAEAEGIVEYVRALRRAVRMEFVVNVGTFVPKPHTPFQWERQTSVSEANAALDAIRTGLPRGTRLRGQDPWMSWLESVLTRGDDAAGRAIEVAHRMGARLDAWGEHLRKGVWEEALSGIPGALSGLGPFEETAALPWERFDLGVTGFHLRRERDRARRSVLTDPCSPDCTDRCGICNREIVVRDLAGAATGGCSDVAGETPNEEARGEPGRAEADAPPEPATAAGTREVAEESVPAPPAGDGQERTYQLVLRYRKSGAASFIPHLGLVRTFERIWQRLGVPLALTEGYHPKARMSFGQPLPLGIDSDDDIVVVSVQQNIQLDTISHQFDAVSPEGLLLRGGCLLAHDPQAPRIPAPMQAYGGAQFSAAGPEDVLASLGEHLAGVGADIGAVAVPESGGPGQFVFSLRKDAPGLGRILKGVGDRDRIGFARIAMLSGDGASGESLFDFYRGLDSCLASFQS